MPASIVNLKGKWYVLITTYDVHHRGEAEEIVSHKLANKHYPARVFPMPSWGDAVVYGNALATEFLDDWSMRKYDSVVHVIVEKEIAKHVHKKHAAAKAELPTWKDKLKDVKGKPSVKVVVKKRRKPIEK